LAWTKKRGYVLFVFEELVMLTMESKSSARAGL